MKPVIAFDLNGTLLETGSLDPVFASALGSSSLRQEWFRQTIELAMADTLSGTFHPFSELAQAAFGMTAERHHRTLDSKNRTELKDAMRNMPPFDDVRPGLEKLQKAGYRLVVLTNSAGSSAEETLSKAGLAAFFERILSAEMVQQYKPAPRVYQAAAHQLGIVPGDMMLVAAHNWDTAGAMRAGCQGAFLRRPGEMLAVTDPEPAIVANDLVEFAESLERRK